MIPTFGTQNRGTDFFIGLGLPFRAFKLIFSTPKVFGLAILSALVTSAALLGAAVFLWPWSLSAVSSMVGDDSGVWRFARAAGRMVLFLITYLLAALTVPNILLAPLLDPISEAVEVRCGNFTAPPLTVERLIKGVWESLRHTLIRLVLMTLGSVMLFPLNFLPAVGSVVWFVASTLWASFWLSVEHLSNPMARHLRPLREVLSVLRQRYFLALGFGLALWVMLWIPVVNFFLMPVAVVMGTLLFRGLRASGDLEFAK
jgi:CysZ protein